jgi:hypothetical protein
VLIHLLVYCIVWVQVDNSWVRCGYRYKVMPDGCHMKGHRTCDSINQFPVDLILGHRAHFIWVDINNPEIMAALNAPKIDPLATRNLLIEHEAQAIEKAEAETLVGGVTSYDTYSIWEDNKNEEMLKQKIVQQARVREQHQKRVEQELRAKGKQVKVIKEVAEPEQVVDLRREALNAKATGVKIKKKGGGGWRGWKGKEQHGKENQPA